MSDLVFFLKIEECLISLQGTGEGKSHSCQDCGSYSKSQPGQAIPVTNHRGWPNICRSCSICQFRRRKSDQRRSGTAVCASACASPHADTEQDPRCNACTCKGCTAPHCSHPHQNSSESSPTYALFRTPLCAGTASLPRHSASIA